MCHIMISSVNRAALTALSRYAKFFAEDLSSECDSVSWTTWLKVSQLASIPWMIPDCGIDNKRPIQTERVPDESSSEKNE